MTENAKFKRYDTCDPALPVLKLTRAGHYLWRLRRKSGLTVGREIPFWEALEILWRLKRELKAEIADRKAEQFKKWRESK